MLRRLALVAAFAALAGSIANAADDTPWRKPAPFEKPYRQPDRSAPETATPWTGVYMGMNGGGITNGDRPAAASPASPFR